MLISRKTNLNEASHVAFASRSGALDEVRPYSAHGECTCWQRT